jgi:cytochrome P450
MAERPAHVPPERVVDFDIYNPPGVEAGFHAAWAALHAQGVPDLVWTPHNGGHWVATRGRLISAVYEDYARFSNRTMLVPKLPMPDGRDARHIVPSYIDPPEHRPYRNLLNSTFAPKAISTIEGKIRDIAVALIEKVRACGRCDFISDYAEMLPIQVFMSLVELPLSDAPMLKSWAERITNPRKGASVEETRHSIEEAHELLHAYLAPHIEARLGGDGDDMFSRMINGRIGDRPLTKSEMRDMCTQVMFGGLDTVVNSLGFVMLHLATTPAHREALAADPAGIPAAIDEFIRRYPVVTVGREVRDDMVLDGVQLMRGEMIMAPTPLAGLDDRLNERPFDVDFERPCIEHTSFGNGVHRCPGAQLARTELRITLEEWLARIPGLEVAPGARVSFRGGVVGRIEKPLPLVWAAPPRP